MDESERSRPHTGAAPSREDRLKQALRANLRRRKTQAKERLVDDPDSGGRMETPDE